MPIEEITEAVRRVARPRARSRCPGGVTLERLSGARDDRRRLRVGRRAHALRARRGPQLRAGAGCLIRCRRIWRRRSRRRARHADRSAPASLYFDEAGSTNDLAARAAEHGEPEGTLFVAGAQTAGRGRLGRTWFSPPDAGLYVSTIIRRARVVPWVTLAAGVAVAEGIRAATGLPVQMKWPNDVVAVGGRKFRAAGRSPASSPKRRADRPACSTSSLGSASTCGAGRFRRSWPIAPGRSRVSSAGPIDGGAVLASVLAALNDATCRSRQSGAPPLLARAGWRCRPRRTAPPSSGTAGAASKRGTTAGLADDGALLCGAARRTAGDVRAMIIGVRRAATLREPQGRRELCRARASVSQETTRAK